jgi:hypothetical protein
LGKHIERQQGQESDNGKSAQDAGATASCHCAGLRPEDPQCGSGDEVALKVEGVVNRTVQAQEALGGSSRLEPLQLALASSDCLMRFLRPIVLPKPLLMPAGQS